MVGVSYQLTGVVAQEREIGMAQLLDHTADCILKGLVYDCGCRYIRVIVASSVRVDKSNMQSDLLVRASGAPDSAWSN